MTDLVLRNAVQENVRAGYVRAEVWAGGEGSGRSVGGQNVFELEVSGRVEYF